MFKKDNKLNQWLWKWHFIAGVISLPFVILLAITGGIYLFKDTYEAPKQAHIKVVTVEGEAMSYQEQWQLAKPSLHKAPNTMEVPTEANQATAFTSGMFSHKNSVYVNPYKGEVTGRISPKDSDMNTVRKLHGELLLGKFGTKIVELIASWLFVLIITGIYVFWPGKKEGIKGFFRVRFKQGKRILFRDLHTVFGFWISVLLLMTLAGGMPWTDVFGSSFKWVQGVTNTGFPKTWDARGLKSNVDGNAISLDEMVKLAKAMDLKGEVSIGLPKDENGVYSIFNTTFDLGAQKRFHFDQYSGKQLVNHNWEDVGILMRGRMWFMAFHQGQFGTWNWVLMITVAVLLAFIAIAALISYLKRKPDKKWGTPKVPSQFKAGYGVMGFIVLLGIVFPLFGASVLVIALVEFFRKRTKKEQALI
ncbi:PepSY-associated TM helix domain-containing protein [Flavivirga rizhaonensis]|uniref:PepSY domain-containing protein n=1 Tax=Flavivirga rizhaonensis TaxID=2559571 RepID=A0A4S1DSN5_9FLAO|nr:PepSY domain-containing protein [Flavivirga rizhaonensis]TGV00745.1 PepSY domain-containing protein [Flavivirga rizhaonensis]